MSNQNNCRSKDKEVVDKLDDATKTPIRSLGFWAKIYFGLSFGIFFVVFSILHFARSTYGSADNPVNQWITTHYQFFGFIGPPLHCTYTPTIAQVPYWIGTLLLLGFYYVLYRNTKVPKWLSISIIMIFWISWGLLASWMITLED